MTICRKVIFLIFGNLFFVEIIHGTSIPYPMHRYLFKKPVKQDIVESMYSRCFEVNGFKKIGNTVTTLSNGDSKYSLLNRASIQNELLSGITYRYTRWTSDANGSVQSLSLPLSENDSYYSFFKNDKFLKKDSQENIEKLTRLKLVEINRKMNQCVETWILENKDVYGTKQDT